VYFTCDILEMADEAESVEETSAEEEVINKDDKTMGEVQAEEEEEAEDEEEDMYGEMFEKRWLILPSNRRLQLICSSSTYNTMFVHVTFDSTVTQVTKTTGFNGSC